jgi:hypothetical protein
MKTCRAPFVEGKPHWDREATINRAEIGETLWVKPPEGLAAFAQICYDRERLKVRLRAEESAILSRFSGPLDMVCRDSCLEFFFSPLAGDPRYFNFEFNPQGALYLGFGPDRRHSIRQYIPSYRELFAVEPFTARGGWGVDFSIPLDFIRIYTPDFSPGPGEKFRANFYKCGDETETPHYLAWNPVDTPQPDFHRPEFFGEIVFE